MKMDYESKYPVVPGIIEGILATLISTCEESMGAQSISECAIELLNKIRSCSCML
jgi:hypothetical protein